MASITEGSRGAPGRELVKAVATLEPLDVSGLLSSTPTSGARGISQELHAADQLVRDVAAVFAPAPPQAQSETVEEVLLPTTGWASDYVIVETY